MRVGIYLGLRHPPSWMRHRPALYRAAPDPGDDIRQTYAITDRRAPADFVRVASQ